MGDRKLMHTVATVVLAHTRSCGCCGDVGVWMPSTAPPCWVRAAHHHRPHMPTDHPVPPWLLMAASPPSAARCRRKPGVPEALASLRIVSPAIGKPLQAVAAAVGARGTLLFT